MSKRITFISKTGLKLVLVALLLTALSTEALARSGSSGRGRDGDHGDRGGRQTISRSSEGGAESRGRARVRFERREERNEARVRQADVQNVREVIEERTSLAAEPMATSSEVKLRLEFPLTATTSNQIAQGTLDRLQFSREEIGRLLVVEPAEAAEAIDFNASLRGGEEVPAVVTNASGTADFELQRGETRLTFILNVTNIENATAAHIHRGMAGEEGPVVANLFLGPTKTGMFSGVLAQSIIEVGDLVGPLAGRPFSDLVDLLRDGRAYVNVHTTQNPDGEIRGQIMTMAQDEPIAERLRVRADVMEDMANVRADFRFAVSGTARAQIIDGIFAKLSALRTSDILNVLDLRIAAEPKCEIVIIDDEDDEEEDRQGPNPGRR